MQYVKAFRIQMCVVVVNLASVFQTLNNIFNLLARKPAIFF